jgi:hypothetical protein
MHAVAGEASNLGQRRLDLVGLIPAFDAFDAFDLERMSTAVGVLNQRRFSDPPSPIHDHDSRFILSGNIPQSLQWAFATNERCGFAGRRGFPVLARHDVSPLQGCETA